MTFTQKKFLSIAIFGLIGLLALIAVQAVSDTGTASFNDSETSGIQSKQDQSAYMGDYIQFNQSQTPPQTGSRDMANYIAPTASTSIPVYDTAWKMLTLASLTQADDYFKALRDNGFTGAWSGPIHGGSSAYDRNYNGGGRIGNLVNGEVVLTDAYIAHVNKMLDSADKYGMKVGLVVAWQNTYLPGGSQNTSSVSGTITEKNAFAYGKHMVEAFGSHPAVSVWVFGGDGAKNTESSLGAWRLMAQGVRAAGSDLSITYHTAVGIGVQTAYVGETWLDFISPQTGHIMGGSAIETRLKQVKAAYGGLDTWQGEPRYFNILPETVGSPAGTVIPDVNEVRADAQAAKNAGVSGYVYGDAGRWNWCRFGDKTPCNANNISASFGAGEAAVMNVFRR